MPYNPQGAGGGITKLSELNIDIDKDWGGYGITNMSGVAAGMGAGSVTQRGLAGILVDLPPGAVDLVLTSQGPGNLVVWAPGGSAFDRWYPVTIGLTAPVVAVDTPDKTHSETGPLSTAQTEEVLTAVEGKSVGSVDAEAVVTPDQTDNEPAPFQTTLVTAVA
jgi:hypothetical protein